MEKSIEKINSTLKFLCQRVDELSNRQMSSLGRIELTLTSEKLSLMEELRELRAKTEQLEKQNMEFQLKSASQNHNLSQKNTLTNDNGQAAKTKTANEASDDTISIASNSDDSIADYDHDDVSPQDLVEISRRSPTPAADRLNVRHPMIRIPRLPSPKPQIKCEFRIDGTAESFKSFKLSMTEEKNFNIITNMIKMRTRGTLGSMVSKLIGALLTLTTPEIAAETFATCPKSAMEGNEITIFERRGSTDLSVFGKLFKAAEVLDDDDLAKRTVLASFVHQAKTKIALQCKITERMSNNRRMTLF